MLNELCQVFRYWAAAMLFIGIVQATIAIAVFAPLVGKEVVGVGLGAESFRQLPGVAFEVLPLGRVGAASLGRKYPSTPFTRHVIPSSQIQGGALPLRASRGPQPMCELRRR